LSEKIVAKIMNQIFFQALGYGPSGNAVH